MRLAVCSMVLALVGILSAPRGFAEACHGPTPPENFPDAATASQADMVAAQNSVKQYLSDMESVLKCMDAQHLPHAMEVAVDDMKKVAAKFNEVLHAYRVRQAA